MNDDMNEAGRRRSGLGLHELSEDLQDLGQVTVNLAGDVLHLASALVTLPFKLLPQDTRSHLKNAAREAGMAAQAVAEGVVETANNGLQEVSRSLRWRGDSVIEVSQAGNENAGSGDDIIIVDEITKFGNQIEEALVRVGNASRAAASATDANDSDEDVLNRGRVDPNLAG